MVAITVILAAVIGTFVLGMSDQVGSDTPRASFGISTAGNTGTVDITHETGDTIDASNVVVQADEAFTGGGGGANGDTWETISGGDTEISAGSMVTLSADDGDFTGATIRVIYNPPDSDSSTTLAKKEIS